VVTSLISGWQLAYDDYGNMTGRQDGGCYAQRFGVENRLVMVTHAPAHSAGADTQTPSVTQFVYDGDGNGVFVIFPDGSWTASAGEHDQVAAAARTGEPSWWTISSAPTRRSIAAGRSMPAAARCRR
jgi:hypothetical protein